MFDLFSDNDLIIVQSHLLNDLGVINGFTMRMGGVSQPPYAELNMAFHTGDNPDDVRENRQKVAKALGIKVSAMVAAEQVHGANAYVVTAKDAGCGSLSSTLAIPHTDIMLTNTDGIVLTSFYADCVPILLADPVQRVVASAHAGWRGTRLHVGAVALRAMHEHFASDPADVRVVIGPAIGPCCYQVSQQMADDFMHEFGADVALGRQLDLRLANKRSLECAGVPSSHIHSAPWCTSCQHELFFSHRASDGVTGRFAALIGMHRAGQ